MPDEVGFLRSIAAAPEDDTARLVYADWLDDRSDPRGAFVRLHAALRAAGPDHGERVAGERELSALRRRCEPAWLAVVEPEHVAADEDEFVDRRRECGCFHMGGDEQKRPPGPFLHADTQDTECGAWAKLLDLVEQAAADGREEFAPLRELTFAERVRIVTLPPTIGKLKAVRNFSLYGSCLVRVPPEIGGMTSLEEFSPYTSYRLHWFPYEITRCRNLRDSTVSTRAIYGNLKYRPPFPQLGAGVPGAAGRVEPERLPLAHPAGLARRCSVCDREFEDRRAHRVWVSLKVATDVLPLLVNACSAECVGRLPSPPSGYVQKPHRGGRGVAQPPPRY